jgi:hypothetical protein
MPGLTRQPILLRTRDPRVKSINLSSSGGPLHVRRQSNVRSPERDEIEAAQQAVDCEIEHGEVSSLALNL